MTAPATSPETPVKEIKKPNHKFLIIGGISVFLLLIISAIVVLVFIKPSSISPTITPTVLPTSIVQNPLSSNLFYLTEGKVYRYDQTDNATTLIYSGVTKGSADSTFNGDSGPYISNNQTHLAFIDGQAVKVVDLTNNSLLKIDIPVPKTGNSLLYLKGFSINSDKLLIYVDCVEDMSGENSNFIDCDTDFKNNSIGFYTNTVGSTSVKKIQVADTYRSNISDLLGWAKFSNDFFLLSTETRAGEQNSIASSDLITINTATDSNAIIKTITASKQGTGTTRLSFYDVDKNGNVLWGETFNPNTQTLHFNDNLLATENSYTGMQLPKFIGKDTDKIYYYSTYNTASYLDVKVLASPSGTILLNKQFRPAGDGRSNLIQSGNHLYIGYGLDNERLFQLIDAETLQTIITLPYYKDIYGSWVWPDIISVN